jgi:cob(I)alamin adenosyltransferase
MKIYTKTGDKGETSLVTGTRVPKYHPRIDAYGTVDELNSYIGMIRSYPIDDLTKSLLVSIQNHLFNIGCNLSQDDKPIQFTLPKITESDIERLEKEMDRLNETLPPITHFILPGGHPLVSFCHIARTVCRRAERIIIRLATETEVDVLIIKYINRLSDYLFVLSRKLSIDFQAEEIQWIP